MKNLLKITTLVIIVNISLTLYINAQAPDTMWTKMFGGFFMDYGYSVQQTSDGGYIVTGTTESYGTGNSNVWLIKTDADGDTLWTKIFGDSDREEGYSVQQTIDGGYIITGITESFGGMGSDVWLIKTNANGDSLWTNTFWGDMGTYVQQTSDSGYVLTGTTHRMGPGIDTYVFLIKTDANGDTLWRKTFERDSEDGGNCVQQTFDGGYIVTGYTWSFETGDADVWLLKTDTNGDTQWSKTYGGSGSDCGYSVQQTSDKGYIVAGATGSYGAGSQDIWLIKTNTDGDSLWTKTMGGTSSDGGYSVQQTSDDGYILTGYTYRFSSGNSDVLLIKVAPDITTTGEHSPAYIHGYQLHQNYPNPFNPATNIEFSIPKSEFVTLRIYNILGEKVVTLVSERLPAGRYKYEWDASDLASGVYLYRLEARKDFMKARKLVLIK